MEREVTQPVTLETEVKDQMLATIYGQAVGDAIGLLTEFMTKDEAIEAYGKKPKMLLYSQKVNDVHRERWKDGDWTDDTDHVVVIIQSLLYNKGELLISDFAPRVHRWDREGFPELGDFGGMGIGATTAKVLKQPEYKTKPQEAAYDVWEKSKHRFAPNGGVMRTSVLGLHQWHDLEAVFKNAVEICKCTHYDPRCQASSVAVSVAVALMLQHTSKEKTSGNKSSRPVDVTAVIKQAYELACRVLTTKEEKDELWWFMNCTKLKLLQLDEQDRIGFTYKCLGAAFWALKQKDFQKALIKVLMAGGDADTNSAVAGAVLACKLGVSAIPQPWLDGLVHKEWLDHYVNRFLKLQEEMVLPIEQRTPSDDLDLSLLLAEDKERHRKKEEERRRKYEEKLEKLEAEKKMSTST
ncbi:hypothetical protein RRG08_062391 [Elysia crispata]|uniref:ADP-ribosylglycohydrolase n=1 Tax=Elysia crispata TaxID=231223 RepID=A0AAE0XQS6_9GAST|nr:hypothetical protein RRG08_062391 [Elysia crispata]